MSVAHDPIRLALWHHRFASVADEMLETLARSAFSPNIRERRDHSAAVFTGTGDMVAQAAAIPVHLGSQPLSVRAAIERFGASWGPGDAVLLNDPWEGGTHLPDLTVVSPVFAPGARPGERPRWIVSTRAHHADVGGMVPGSLPLSREIAQEGLRLPPVRIVRGGEIEPDLLRILCANSRTPAQRRGDLVAQLAASALGARRLAELEQRAGAEMHAFADALIAYAERTVRALFASIEDGRYRAEDAIDSDGVGGGPLPLRVEIRVRGDHAEIDFAGTAAACAGPLNACPAIVHAAVGYVLRAVCGVVLEERADGDALPANAGLLRPVTIRIPRGSLLDPPWPHAVAGGNVETSQRIVDALLMALAAPLRAHMPAASCGSMNNLTLGGADPRRGGARFVYYETIGGGAGAGPTGPGESGVHVHMTNTRNTPVEVLEHELPVRVHRHTLRRGSGGPGRQRGGDGIVREIEALAPMTATLLTERRHSAPPGLAGGAPGARGRNAVQRADASEPQPLPDKCTLELAPGDRLRIETPGGGGWGRPAAPQPEASEG
ncbi:MAG: hydantoinase B/oxoprolinase family protein [Planctomycetota bacterium]|nr:MAG: hydantoinase B/oxoprolinase family protein [Planctomycetota bacterium]